MSKIKKGIYSVDLQINASGHGVVNWNGNVQVKTEQGLYVNNHKIPKLRGYTSNNGDVSENGFCFKKTKQEIDLMKTPLFISQNCIKNNLFKESAHDLNQITSDNAYMALSSIAGLFRGYAITGKGKCKRKSPLLFEDMIDTLGNGNVEIFSLSTSKESNTFYSKITFGDTAYLGYASISIEDLSFISLDSVYDRAAAVIKSESDGHFIENQINEFLKDLDFDEKYNAKCEFGKYVRKGSIYGVPETGILFNQDAINLLISEMIDKISELNIRQGQGYMNVDSVLIDYNDSKKTMRIKNNIESINNDKKDIEYAVYYEKVE